MRALLRSSISMIGHQAARPGNLRKKKAVFEGLGIRTAPNRDPNRAGHSVDFDHLCSRAGDRGGFMRLAMKRRADWLMSSDFPEGRQHQVRSGGDWIDVLEMGRGDPIVLVPGLAGGWKLLAPLAHLLARHHRV